MLFRDLSGWISARGWQHAHTSCWVWTWVICFVLMGFWAINAEWSTVAFKIRRKGLWVGISWHCRWCGAPWSDDQGWGAWHVPYVLFWKSFCCIAYTCKREGRWALPDCVSWILIFGKPCLFSRWIASATQLPPNGVVGCCQARSGRQ